ncbi:GntR family transcriptional regulator [uncultured Cohaesibacter sp.]|uniref:GntR family transcriptional regulator n=1 Tax=uncultured Cohaesibacter sp. TaxID=1002546 RepID=UPI0029C695E9|nr:GntR family transcriptional regulator [uncultured Cohaesibacter sp.]
MTDLAYNELRNAIISLRIQPGERLDAESIGASLGFSRAPVIEAINLLRAEGLVVAKRRVGTFASEIGPEQMEEVFDAREMLEEGVVPIVVHNVSDRQIQALSEILDEGEKLLDVETSDDFDYRKFMELDAQFHSDFIALSERQLFKKWFDELAGHMQRVRYLFQGNALERSLEGHREHRAILAALHKRDIAELRKCLHEHTERSRKGCQIILGRE